jgi:hypothetical protein
MSKHIQGNPKNVIHSLYHHGLVKLLIMEELRKRNDTWDAFLERNGFHSIVVPNIEVHQEDNVVTINDDRDQCEDLNSPRVEGFTTL